VSSPPRTQRSPAEGAQRVAVLSKRGRFLVAEPFFERGQRVVVGRDPKARPGDLVLLRADRRGKQARILRVLGRPDVAQDVIEAVMHENGLRRSFDPAVEREAREARDRGGRDDVRRRDLRDTPTFTIDPETARDYDDAISAEVLPDGGIRVSVHIADVSAFVPPRSLVDREAYRRGTSVYVPGKVEPMLPEALSNDACSLVPAQDRSAVTVEMDFDGPRVVRAAFHRSLIRSDARLTYGQVDRIFGGDEEADPRWRASLEAARDVASALDAARTEAGALAVETEEPMFQFDSHGHVVGVEQEATTESHKLIEHLMIAANEQVATHLETQRVGALYRVHERPDPLRIENLAAQLASLDVATPPIPEHMSPQQAADLAGEMSRMVDAHVRRRGRGRLALTSLVLRALKQAHYTPHNLGHAGLHSPRYCHFTSPIRRYPDLICHRALLSSIGAGEDAPEPSRLEEAGAWTSAREREAMTIERGADDVARCFLLERELYDRGWDAAWEGEIVGVIGAGAFVAFGGGFEGLVPVRRLRGEWWELNEEGTILYGTRSGNTMRLGDEITVRVDRVEAPRGRVDLLPVEG
jgi:ribonuclease R